METLEPLLSEHPFLKGLDPKHLQLITGCASNVRFDAGQIIFREGEEADQFYIIRNGKVALQIYTPGRGSIIIDTLTEGDILGWSWLIPPYQWRFDAVAGELTRAIALDGKCLRNKCESDHDLGYELLKRFASIVDSRLESTRLRLLDMYDSNP
ncbi:MAG: cyclic nucleotide-binding domain-containing protein [Ignavibacteriales bacterium]|jgi:CRP/FNR family cyclic AMP-dependent transcriptional regulator|nr:cyclic nucleotide-binding domain-containing protein [Ignavibacteriales bacterium]